MSAVSVVVNCSLRRIPTIGMRNRSKQVSASETGIVRRSSNNGDDEHGEGTSELYGVARPVERLDTKKYMLNALYYTDQSIKPIKSIQELFKTNDA